MATTIITKNGSGAPTADDLSVGELAVDLTNKRLYSKNSSSEVIELGVNAAADTTFGDNVKAIFGAGSDLQIYHDATDSIINDNGTGSLKLQQGGSTKLEVTTTGIDVTGTVTADGLTVDGNGKFTGTATGATASSVGNKVVVDDTENGISILSSTSGAGYLIFGDSDDNDIGMLIYDHSANALITYVNAAEAMRIDSSGKLLVGATTSAAGVLVVDGNSANNIWVVGRDSDGTGSLSFRNNADNAYNARLEAVNGNLAIETNGSEAMRIDSSGNVGIGTSSLSAGRHLTIGNATAPAQSFQQNGTEKFLLGISGVANGGVTGSASGDFFARTTGGKMLFSTDDGVTAHATIDSSGNVGIGTTSLNFTASGRGNVNINGSTDALLVLSKGASSTTAAYFYFDGTDADVRNINNGALKLSTNNTERMRIDSSGNVGIGTSSPGSSTNYNTLTINGTTGGIVEFHSGGSLQSYILGNSSELRMQSQSTQPLTFNTNGTERMRIDSNGNLLVGTTSALAPFTLSKSNADWLAHITNTNASPRGLGIFHSTDANNTSNWFLYCEGGGTTQRFSVRSNGGIANYQANDANLSDERVKTDIAPLGSMWDKFKALEIVTFKYKDQTHDDDNIGVIAQQVEAVAPEFVDNDGFGETPEGEEPLKAIYTADMYHAAIKALQEAMDRIETLEAKVAQLEGAN